MSKNIPKSPKNETSKGKRKVRKKPKATETVQELLLSYQVNVKERKLEELQIEVELLEDEEKHHLERIAFLKQEQETLFKNLAIQAKLERQKSHNEMPLSYKKEEALDQLKKNIQVRNQLQLEIDELDKKIQQKCEEFDEQDKILEKLIQFRDHGQFEMDFKIRKVRQEIEDEKNKHAFMMEQLRKEFELENEKLDEETLENIRQLKIAEANKAVNSLGRPEIRILSTNEWLTKEVEVHREVVEKKDKEVKKMEEEILDLVEKLEEKHQTLPSFLSNTVKLLGLKSELKNQKEEAKSKDCEQLVPSKWPVTQEMLLKRLRDC